MNHKAPDYRAAICSSPELNTRACGIFAFTDSTRRFPDVNSSLNIASINDFTCYLFSTIAKSGVHQRHETALFIERLSLNKAISHAQRHEDTKVALLFIDLDGFKYVNDNYGHDIGDLLLVEVSRRIRGVLRSEDTTARQGGDEFIVTLPNIKQALGASVVAEKLLQALASPYQIDKHEIHISASIGLALYPDNGTDVETLLKHSDSAMYVAKMAGKNVYRYYDPEMHFLTGP